eukprot:CAMPEP_0204457908 /NCGR_PEP_ID=MMETSP0471-20130131/3120_1 /ASSEMBLY_ACC=CAM_ASM_000602 /TAXON_ID=2969 /ORGANISM="Oxyrrhis marina" /LENGTH=227 /DNA_ID=CAMNT_0051458421 /DNA_START=34 /DNA_END=713 /DNA_ORIENTATION=-
MVVRKHSLDSISQEICDFVAQVADAAVRERGRFVCCLSGGSMPKFLAPLSKMECDFAHWHVFYADERCVPLDHEDSNHRACSEAFLSGTSIPPAQIYAINACVEPAQAALEYQESLRALFPEIPLPKLDVALLGMGPDGHTASLFPNHPLVQYEGPDWVVPIEDSPKPPACRITMTLPVLNAAANVAFLATGASKAEVIPRVVADPDPLLLFMAVVGRVWMFVGVCG